jgi:tryptophanyl-tRNA synthetase
VPRILSGVQPTGNTHLGNYVGARSWGWTPDRKDRSHAEGVRYPN